MKNQEQHLKKIIEKQDEIIKAQALFISYLLKYSGESIRIDRFKDNVKKIKSELSILKTK